MGVIVGRSREEIMAPYIDRYFQQQQESSRLKQQQGQFDQTYALDKQKTDALTNDTNARLGMDQAKLKADGFLKNVYSPLVQAGKVQDAIAATQQFLAQNPDAQPVLAGYATQRPQTDLDTAAQNTAAFSKNETGKAAVGSQDAQARNFTTLQATGQQLSAPAFADQSAKQLTQPELAPKGTEYGTAVRAGADLVPTANAQLQAKTAITQTGMQQAGEDRRQKSALDATMNADPAMVQDVIDHPQAYFNLPMNEKKAVAKALGRVPVKLSDREADQIDGSLNGMQLLDDIQGIIEKWAAKGIPINGPAIGRYNQATNTFGGSVLPQISDPALDAEYQQDVAKVQEWMTVLPMQEARALIGGRPSEKIIQTLTNASPQLAKNPNFMKGSIEGARKRFKSRFDTLSAKSWSGKVPTAKGEAPSTGGMIVYGEDGKRVQ